MDKCPKLFAAQMMSNIVVSGGNSNILGFKQRIFQDLESLKPDDCTVKVAQIDDPQFAVCRGLKNLSCSESFIEHAVTRAEWEESGLRAFLKCIL